MVGFTCRHHSWVWRNHVQVDLRYCSPCLCPVCQETGWPSDHRWRGHRPHRDVSPIDSVLWSDQLLQIIHNPASFGIGLLLIMVVVKALLTSTSFATGLEGGPIFPLLFMGGTLGLAISKGLTFIPEGVAVTVGMAGPCVRCLPNAFDDISLTRAYGRTNRSIASNCYWGSHRFHSIESDHAPTSETSFTVVW